MTPLAGHAAVEPHVASRLTAARGRNCRQARLAATTAEACFAECRRQPLCDSATFYGAAWPEPTLRNSCFGRTAGGTAVLRRVRGDVQAAWKHCASPCKLQQALDEHCRRLAASGSCPPSVAIARNIRLMQNTSAQEDFQFVCFDAPPDSDAPLQLALSVRDDADLDPLAALRRNSISRSVASPRGGAGPSAAEQPPSPSPALANSPRSFQRAANVFTTQLMSRVGPVVPKAGGEAALRRLRTSPRQVYARPLLQDSIGRRRSPPRVKSPPGRGVDPVMDAIKRHEAARQHNDEMVKAVQAGNVGYGNYWTEQRYEKKQAAKQAAVDAALRHHRLARDPELLSQLLCANSETGGDAIAGEEVDTPIPARAPPDDLFDMTPVLRQSTTTEDEPTPPAPEPPHNVDPPSHDEQRPNNLPPISKATIRFYQEEEAMQRLANSPLRQHPLTGRPGTARPQKEGGAAPPRRPMTARCAGSFPLAAQESADRASPPKRGGKQQRGPVRKADGTASLTQENLRITKLAREADEVMELLEQNRNLTNEKRRVIIAGQR